MRIMSLFTILCLVSCATSKMYEPSITADYSRESTSLHQERESIFVTTKSEKDNKTATSDNLTRKIIYNAQLTQQVDSITPSRTKALYIMQSYQGFMLQSTSNSISMRIPAEQLDNALNDFKKIGKSTYENINGNDVTDNYYDIKIRLENAEKTRNRYLELLEQAKDVSEVLKVEKELERLNEKIERFKGQIKNYDQQIAYSLVTINFQTKDRTRPGPLGYVFVGLYKAVKWLFVWN